MVKFINAEEVLALRSAVLRGHKPLAECVFPGDDLAETFHLAYFKHEEIVCVASFYAQPHEKFPGRGYQLRGMATAENYRGQGIGNQLLNFAITYLRGQKADYLWCNARKKAYSFYKDIGFEFISPEFEITGIGIHRQMYLKIR
ncbi:MAG TPA: GNAT family N-acetyltransferase [Daejeonella sp.]|nr:GNAT family N-acetyltransferase [Daejeonella sp.]